MSKREKLSITLVMFGLVLYLVQNFYFGWNREAQSIAELVADWAVVASVLIGFIIKPVRQEYHYTTIQPKTLKMYGDSTLDTKTKPNKEE